MNFPIYTDQDIKDRAVDFDMSQVFGMPFIERTIFQYALRETCFAETTRYMDTKLISSSLPIHPKYSLPEAREVLGCFVKK